MFVPFQIAYPANCDQMYENLVRIHTNIYKNKYPHLKDTSFTRVTVDECKLILATSNEANEVLFDYSEKSDRESEQKSHPFFCLPSSSPIADSGKQMEEMKKGKWKKLREKFSAKNAEKDSKL
ncbi:ubiquinol-cytochrome-c reductase complex assembly factor 2-like [Macrochelys suwanniensis]